MLGRRMPWESSMLDDELCSSAISSVFADFTPRVSGEDGDSVGSGRGAAALLLLGPTIPRPLM